MELFGGEGTWQHEQYCEKLSRALTETIDVMMKHIFDGKCRSPQELEDLFKAVNHALFLRDYLRNQNSSLTKIAAMFLGQFEDWIVQMGRAPSNN